MEPISRDTLRGMYAERIAEQRKQTIQQQVGQIYQQIRGTASTSTKTSFTTQFPNNNVVELIPEILSELRILFPDTKLEYIEIKNINKRTGQMEITGHVLSADWS